MRPAHTQYQALHGAGGVLADALAALPDYPEAAAAYSEGKRRLEDYVRELEVPSDAAAADRILALLDQDEPLPASLPSDTWHRTHAIEMNIQLENVFSSVLQLLAGRRDQVIDSGCTAVMSHLDREIRACVTEARALDLGDASNAEEAIDAGMGDAWGRMRQLRLRYTEVRNAQQTMIRTAYGNTDYDLQLFGFLANVTELVPRWADIKRGRTMLVDGDHFEMIDGGRYPWLPALGMLDDEVEDSHDLRFTWLVATPAAVPWVPTPEQLRQAAKAASDIERANRPKPDRKTEASIDRDLERARVNHQANAPLREGADPFSIGSI
jgi:hypothetical protein